MRLALMLVGWLVVAFAALVAASRASSPDQPSLAEEAMMANADGARLLREGKYAESIERFQRALTLRRQLFPKSTHPDGHPDVAETLDNLGLALKIFGDLEQARPYYEEGLAMWRGIYPASRHPTGHVHLAISLNNFGMLLQTSGATAKALPYYEESLAMFRRLFPATEHPDGHPFLAQSLNNLAHILRVTGSSDKALPLYEQALAMRRRLYPAATYPTGHADLAQSLDNLSGLLHELGNPKQALPLGEEALTMYRRLYPPSAYPYGHPELAHCLNNLGVVQLHANDFGKARRSFEQVLITFERLYPGGHGDVAQALSNLGMAWLNDGKPEQALPHLKYAAAMRRSLLPKGRDQEGHPDLAVALSCLARCRLTLGAKQPAVAHFHEAFAMEQRWAKRLVDVVSEAESLALEQSRPPTRDAYLSILGPDEAAAAYQAVWDSKATVTRVLERRHAAARAAGAGQSATLEQLRDVRRRMEALLQDPRRRPEDRDKLLVALSDQRDRLERALIGVVPEIQRWRERDALNPGDLAKALPPNSVFVDLVRWRRHEIARTKNSEVTERWTPGYLAFVVAPGQRLTRVELGPAALIDEAIQRWRSAIDARRQDTAPDPLLTELWARIARDLPVQTRTLYLALDGELARMPWAALPGSAPGTILLEQFTIATVPHGPFLLEQLRFPRRPVGSDTLLLVGDLTYQSERWAALPGARAELDAVVRAAAQPPAALTRLEATPLAVATQLSTVRYAHFATHGFFQGDELAAERQRADAAIRAWRLGQTAAARVAAKNPLGFVGLVLSDDKVMSGLTVLDLDLEAMRLVTLSACETGLGEFAAAKGVESLQLAFHLAGCPNVVASLWKVNDAATAALMAKFYHEMWVNKKPPIEALREAQLTIYRHPELIPDLAGERGAPRLKEAVAVRVGAPATNTGKHADTKLWAAFVLSGVSR